MCAMTGRNEHAATTITAALQKRASATDEPRMIVRVAAARALADMTSSYGT